MASWVVLLLLAVSAVTFADGFLDFPDPGGNPDIYCMIRHCRNESMACARDARCSNNIRCMTSCGLTNHACVYKCLNTYEDANLNAYLKCLVNDFHCLRFEPPNADFRCNPPKDKVLTKFKLNMMEGPWYIVRGLNRDYDCFDCQISTYSPTLNSRNFTLGELYDVSMLNGSIRHRKTSQQMQQSDPTKALVDSTATLMGMTMYEKWYFLDVAANGNYAIAYYCGHMSGNGWYEGNLVYSRQPTLGPLDVVSVANILQTTLGHSMEEYCVPNNTDCNKPNSSI